MTIRSLLYRCMYTTMQLYDDDTYPEYMYTFMVAIGNIDSREVFYEKLHLLRVANVLQTMLLLYKFVPVCYQMARSYVASNEIPISTINAIYSVQASFIFKTRILYILSAVYLRIYERVV